MAESPFKLFDRGFVVFVFVFVIVLSQVCSRIVGSSQSIVEFLPGFDGPLPFVLETGYIGVDEGEEVQLFYYFIESENNPKEDPLILWLTGGPGCSAISGILYQIGPIQFEEVKYNGSLPRLRSRPHSWTKVASIIFLDLPVDTGFSYATTSRASHTGDFKAARNADEFLRKWLVDHPQFLSNPVYLGGDSYTGVTLPIAFKDMIQGNEKDLKPSINLEGYMLGNPSTDVLFDNNYRIPYSHGMALISDELYQSLQISCGGDYLNVDPTNLECRANMQAFEELISHLDTAMILEPQCGELFSPSSQDSSAKLRRSMIDDPHMFFHHLLGQGFSCRNDGYELVRRWMNVNSVREALHIRKGTIGEWVRCNDLNYTEDVESTVSYHAYLSSRGYRSLIYSGDHDMIVPFLSTQAWIRSLNYSIVDDWRPWIVDGQVAGYTRTYANHMTFATVKGAGHTGPEYRPKQCDAMFRRWVSGQPL